MTFPIRAINGKVPFCLLENEDKVGEIGNNVTVEWGIIALFLLILLLQFIVFKVLMLINLVTNLNWPI